MTDHDRIRVADASRPAELSDGGLHWFRIEFDDGEGHCFITSGEALRVPKLSCHWVERALLNLASKHGYDWLKTAAGSSPGLMLQHSDQHDVWVRRPEGAGPAARLGS